MDQALSLVQPARPPGRLIQTPAFWLGFLALLLLGIFESRFIAWCWPTYGESACGRYSLPLNFVLDLAFFLLVVLVFDHAWWAVLLVSVVALEVYHAGNLVRALPGVFGGEGQPFLTQAASFLAGWAIMTLIQTLLRFLVPAAILRWLARRSGGLSSRAAVLFGVSVAAFAAAYHIALFGGAAIVSPGSVAPGSIFTPLDLLGALLTGLAAWLAVLIGRAVRVRQS